MEDTLEHKRTDCSNKCIEGITCRRCYQSDQCKQTSGALLAKVLDLLNNTKTRIGLKNVDILHPLASVKWDRRGSLPVTLPSSVQVILVDDRLCIGTEYTVYLASRDLKSWKTMVTRAHDFALAYYDSKILTIGGLDSACSREITGESWILDVSNKTYESSSVPPLLEKRHSATAVSVVSAKSLVIAGGADDKKVLDSVEVFVDGKWTFVQRLPTPEFRLQATVHDGTMFFTGNSISNIYSCPLEELMHSSATLESESESSLFSKWRIFPSTLSLKSPVSFGKHFCIVGIDGTTSDTSIETPSSDSPDRQWVRVAVGPSSLKSQASVVLHNGSILLVGSDSKHIYRGTLNMPSYSSSSKFTEHALSKLEEHGMPVLKAMETLADDVKKAVKLDLSTEEESKLSEIDGMECVSAVLRLWLAGRGLRSPTWRSLLDLLKDIKEEKLSQQIESYLNTTSGGSIARNPKRPRPAASTSVSAAPYPRLSDVKEQTDDSSLVTPRRSSRVKSRPDRYGTPRLH